MISWFLKLSLILLFFIPVACKKDIAGNKPVGTLVYYEVAMKETPADWRDSSFIVATSDAQLISKINAQLLLPVSERQLVNGALAAGSAGYNKNASHEFKWHFQEDDWTLSDVSIEIGDGRPYSDVDNDTTYWIHNVKRFAPWSSYISRKIKVE